MATLQIYTSTALFLALSIDSGRVRFTGNHETQEIVVTYGYFVNDTEVLVYDSMRPEFRLEDTRILLRQKPEQAARATAMGAQMSASIIAPDRLRFEGGLKDGILTLSRANGCDIRMNDGIVEIYQCRADIKIDLRSGNLKVDSLIRGQIHYLKVQTGNIILHAGALLGLAEAYVHTGTIEGEYMGRLERVGISGWHLLPATSEPGTSVECKVGTGIIRLYGSKIP